VCINVEENIILEREVYPQTSICYTRLRTVAYQASAFFRANARNRGPKLYKTATFPCRYSERKVTVYRNQKHNISDAILILIELNNANFEAQTATQNVNKILRSSISRMRSEEKGTPEDAR